MMQTLMPPKYDKSSNATICNTSKGRCAKIKCITKFYIYKN